ncbi:MULTISPECIES: LysM peptidoglycan-binding domain-containing protein [unclassified Corallococcus]|uniref:LysM peptidoglycan-binding domain-containing protein n=1 Tax=unclassified Corallococcus TaxID=2685029 RepID=UPI001A8CA22A|nr:MULTISPECIES: LysM domain-containing protein [unclassified Corallococcus]MBN9684442.1 LysM peptidoglycan-binding domain-containing protein [Corallococcus sp. NCSPR001]WAS84081.1 LysM domain-containing protein [Corallococcus sp. NCRR]
MKVPGIHVRPGDSLSVLAKRHHTTVDALAKANNIQDPNKIQAGQRLRLGDGFDSKDVRRAAAGGQGIVDAFVQAGRGLHPGAATAQGANRTRPPVDTPHADPAKPGRAVHVKVPYYSQFKGGHGYTPSGTACFDAAKAMAGAKGVTVQDSKHLIQVGRSENRVGALTVDSKKAAEGRKYIDQQLGAGKPVVVGVSHKDSNYNVDHLTDHFVTITGRGVDEKGRTYYTFHDPGTSHESKGKDTNPNNRFYVDEKTGKMSRPGKAATGSVTERRYDVAMVRING